MDEHGNAQTGAACIRIGRERLVSLHFQTGVDRESAQIDRGKAGVDVAHGASEVGPIVRGHVEQDDPATRYQDPGHLGEYGG